MARNFNGTSDNIRIDTVARLTSWYNDPGGRAFVGWLKAPAGQSNVFMYSEGASGNNTNFWGLSLISGGTNLLRASGLNFPAGGLSSVSVVADSTWHHVAAVLYPNPTGTNNWFGLYVDGVLEASQGSLTSSSSGANTNEATLGALRRSGGTPASFYKGLLAHWAIWNRALSGEEVRMLARGTRLPSDLGPTHYWPMSHGEVGYAIDRGHSRAHGTLAGTSVSADSPKIKRRVTPANWPHRYGAIASSSVTITLTDSGALALQSDAPTVPVTLASATLSLAADDAIIYPVTVAINPLTLAGDNPAQFGATQTSPGVLSLAADAPSQSGSTSPTPGILRLFGVTPRVSGITTTVSGSLRLTADAPTVCPVTVGSATLVLASDGASLSPAMMVSGQLVVKGDAPTVYPVALDSSGKLVLSAGAPSLSNASVTLSASGILRLRSDTPVVTPLSEPVSPPPPPPGTGARISVSL